MTSSPNQQDEQTNEKQVSDAAPRNWVDSYAPPTVRPYLRLARADRPIGTWLLLWPCWWSIALAASQTNQSWPELSLLGLFALGAIVMRGAGCTYNDIIDKDIDAQVARTRSRPIPSGAVSLFNAWAFLSAQCLIGLFILLTLNGFAILLGAASLLLIAIYPFMKRFTYWPQAFLGLTFNWGALLGWAAVTGELSLAPLCLYAGGIAWTLGYDTIYAHQDKEDDALVGVKSSALRLGQHTKLALIIFYAFALASFGFAGFLAGLNWPFYGGLMVAALHLAWQVRTLDIDDASNCLQLFRVNRDFGGLLFVAILIGSVF